MWVVENDFILVWQIGVGLVSMKRSKITFVSFRIEINWAFVSGHRNRLDVRLRIKSNLISAIGSKLNWFLCPGSKSTWFCVGIELDLVFVRGSKSTSVLCAGRK